MELTTALGRIKGLLLRLSEQEPPRRDQIDGLTGALDHAIDILDDAGLLDEKHERDLSSEPVYITYELAPDDEGVQRERVLAGNRQLGGVSFVGWSKHVMDRPLISLRARGIVRIEHADTMTKTGRRVTPPATVIPPSS